MKRVSFRCGVRRGNFPWCWVTPLYRRGEKNKQQIKACQWQRWSKAKAFVNHISTFRGAAAKVKLKVELVSRGSGHWPPYFVGLGWLMLCLRQRSLVFRADISQGPGVWSFGGILPVWVSIRSPVPCISEWIHMMYFRNMASGLSPFHGGPYK